MQKVSGKIIIEFPFNYSFPKSTLEELEEYIKENIEDIIDYGNKDVQDVEIEDVEDDDFDEGQWEEHYFEEK